MVGAHLLSLLCNIPGISIVALRRESSDMALVPESDAIRWVTGRLTDTPFLIQVMKGIDVCIHSAGMISVTNKNKDVLNKVNGMGTAAIVNAALEAGVSRMVHVSSVAALGREGKGPIDETADYYEHESVSAYGKSKHLGDLEAYRGMAEGLSVNIVRPSLILGSGHWGLGSDSIFVRAFQGVPFFPAGGTGVVDVRDVARMIQHLAETASSGLDVIANGANCTFKSLQAKIAQVFDKEPPNRVLKDWMIRWIALGEKITSFLSGRDSILTRQSLQRAQNEYYYDAKKSVEQLQFDYTDIDETIEDCCRAFLKYAETGQKEILQFE